MLGIDSLGGIQGVLGYLPYDDSRQPDLSLTLWKAVSRAGAADISNADRGT